ncbi:hypothetical protein PAMC26577_04995 [Caballeronia sordidicola]|uniref:Uncharacterized protein n=1 Tax=Caballeronia sordidicola TaxID=196367 RepID=A0A242N4D1_CABSO|nr:hypothetical protein PAMC26577_04995 [Caballeronia sordidicola]
MAHLRELPSPVVRPSTRFHTDETGSPVREELEKLCPLDLFVHDLASFLIDVVHLKHRLRNINAHRHRVHLWILRLSGIGAFCTTARRCRWSVGSTILSGGYGWSAFISFTPELLSFRRSRRYTSCNTSPGVQSTVVGRGNSK